MELEANQAGQLTPPTPQTTSASGNRLATPLQASPYGNNSPLKSAIKAPLQSMKVTPTGSPKQTPTIRNPYSLPDDNIETAVPPSSAKDDSVRSPKRIIRNNGNLLSNLKSYAMGGKDNESAVSIRKSAQILEPKPLESKQAPSTDPKDDGDSTNSVEDRFASATSLLSKFTAPSAHTAKMPPRLHRVPIPKPASSYVSANVSDASVTNPSDDIKSPGYFSYRTGVGGINSFKKPEIDKNHINDASVSSSQSPTVTSTSSHGSNDGLYERLKRPVLSLPAGSYNSNSSATTPILSASSFLNRIGTHDGNTGTVHNKSFGNVNNSGENKKSEKRVTYSSDVIK